MLESQLFRDKIDWQKATSVEHPVKIKFVRGGNCLVNYYLLYNGLKNPLRIKKNILKGCLFIKKPFITV